MATPEQTSPSNARNSDNMSPFNPISIHMSNNINKKGHYGLTALPKRTSPSNVNNSDKTSFSAVDPLASGSSDLVKEIINYLLGLWPLAGNTNSLKPTPSLEEEGHSKFLQQVDNFETVLHQFKRLGDGLQRVEDSVGNMQKRMQKLELDLQKVEDNQRQLDKFEEQHTLPVSQPAAVQPLQHVGNGRAASDAELVGRLGGAMEGRVTQLEDTLRRQVDKFEDALQKRLERALQQQFDKLEHANLHVAREKEREREREQEQEQENSQAHTNATAVNGALSSPRRRALPSQELEIPDDQVQKSFSELKNRITELVHKHFKSPTNDDWKRIIGDEPWASKIPLDYEGTVRTRCLARQVADIIYGELFITPFFAFDDDTVENGLVKFEKWIMIDYSKTDATQANKWLIQTMRIADDYHREQRQQGETKITKRLMEQIKKSFGNILKSRRKTNHALRRLCYDAVDCAFLLHSSGGMYIWEQGGRHATQVKSDEVNTNGPRLSKQTARNDSDLFDVAFMVYGALTKAYTITENGRAIIKRTDIEKAEVMLL